MPPRCPSLHISAQSGHGHGRMHARTPTFPFVPLLLFVSTVQAPASVADLCLFLCVSVSLCVVHYPASSHLSLPGSCAAPALGPHTHNALPTPTLIHAHTHAHTTTTTTTTRAHVHAAHPLAAAWCTGSRRSRGWPSVTPRRLRVFRHASRAVLLHPRGGQFDFVWLPARTPHGGASYVW